MVEVILVTLMCQLRDCLGMDGLVWPIFCPLRGEVTTDNSFLKQ